MARQRSIRGHMLSASVVVMHDLHKQVCFANGGRERERERERRERDYIAFHEIIVSKRRFMIIALQFLCIRKYSIF